MVQQYQQANGSLTTKILTGVSIILIAGAITTVIMIYAKQEVLISQIEDQQKQLDALNRACYGDPYGRSH